MVELPRVDGKRRYKRISLHTNNYYEARERIKQMGITFEQEIEHQMRLNLATTPFQTQAELNKARDTAIHKYNTEYAAIHPEAQLNMTLKQPNYKLKNRISNALLLLYAVGIVATAGMLFSSNRKAQKAGLVGLAATTMCSGMLGSSKDGYGY